MGAMCIYPNKISRLVTYDHNHDRRPCKRWDTPKLTFSAYLAAEQGRLLEIENLRYSLDQKDVGILSQKIKSIRQQAWDNLKFYNYSLTDIEKAASETVPWQ